MAPDASLPTLAVRGVSKRFGGVAALSGVSLSLHRGEILAVVGENGAGKSTLVKILAGVLAPDAGQILMGGAVVTMASAHAALKNGVVLIHQELNLADNLDVAANIFLGREPHRFGFIDQARIHDRARELLARVGLRCSPSTLVSSLSLAQQQMVEIAKALSIDAQVLIMDEPTSSLTSHESAQLFKLIRELRGRGLSVLYISHRLGEVEALSDRVVVLRDGQNAGELRRAEVSHDRLVEMMIGRGLARPQAASQARSPGEVMLSVEGLRTRAYPLHELSFSVRAGEIVGIAGLVGAGRTEVLSALFGVIRAEGGVVRVKGEPVSLKSPIDAIDAGIALVPEDRRSQGLVLEMALGENLRLASLRGAGRWGLLDRAREQLGCEEMVKALNVKTPSGEELVEHLSGGNQQKVVLAKWLSLKPRVLLLDEPTRGVDIAAKQEIYRLMEQLAERGVAILFVSSEMQEILRMADRAWVMHEGRILGELLREELSEEAVMRLCTGVTGPTRPSEGQRRSG